MLQSLGLSGTDSYTDVSYMFLTDRDMARGDLVGTLREAGRSLGVDYQLMGLAEKCQGKFVRQSVGQSVCSSISPSISRSVRQSVSQFL